MSALANQTSVCRFLLVEDDDSHAMMIRFALENDVCELERLNRGEEAIERVRSSELDPPDVILLDLRLPGLDGFAVLEVIRSHRIYDRVPVIVLTTSSSDRDHARAEALGANSYVVKPVGFTAFCDAITKLRDYWSEVQLRPKLPRDRFS